MSWGKSHKTYGFCQHHKTPISAEMWFEKCLPRKCNHRIWKNKEPKEAKTKNGIKVLAKTRRWS